MLLEALETVNVVTNAVARAGAYAVIAASLLVISYFALFAFRQGYYIKDNKDALVKVAARHERENSELSAQAVKSRTLLLNHYTDQRKLRFQKAAVVVLVAAPINTLIGFLV